MNKQFENLKQGSFSFDTINLLGEQNSKMFLNDIILVVIIV